MSGERSRSRITRGIFGLAVLAAAVMGTRVLGADPVQAAPDLENGFVVAINEARSEEGLGLLLVDDGLTDAAREWTGDMVDDDELAHAVDITLGVPPGWTKAGENVGRGDSVAGLMDAFIASPGHRRNLLDPEFNRIGVGSMVNPAGVLYTTHRFAMAPPQGSAPHIVHTTRLVCGPEGGPDGGLDGAQIVVDVANTGSDPAAIAAWVGYHAEQAAVIAGGSVASFVAANQPEGETRLRLFVGDHVIADDAVTVAC